MRQRIRVRFAKTGDLRWISHHDLMRLWERLLRRSLLPIAYSEGFNPRPRMSFPLALGIGIESDDEAIEVELDRWMTEAALDASLRSQAPPGLRIQGLELLSPGEKGRVERVEYEVALTPEEAGPLRERMAQALSRAALPVVRSRNGKTIDLAPYLMDARVDPGMLRFSFRVTEEGTARPEEFCSLLGLDLGQIPVRVRKTATRMAPPPVKAHAMPRRPRPRSHKR